MTHPTRTADLVDDDEPDTDLDPVPLPARRVHHPAVPITLEDLAALRGEALEVLEARSVVLDTARKRMLRATSPTHWNFYKADKGQITGFLSDAGMQVIRPLLSVSIFHVSKPEKIMAADGQSFMYLQSAWGKSHMTGQVVEDVEGGRSSTEDFCRKERESGEILALELKVRKACRANVNGNIGRELCGLKNVPLEEIVAAWEGTGKDWTKGHMAQGFGSMDERHGALPEDEPDVVPPTCKVCKGPDGQPLPLVYRRGRNGKPPFYGCANYQSHPNVRVTVNVDQWLKTNPPKASQPPDEAALREDIKRQDQETVARERKE